MNSITSKQKAITQFTQSLKPHVSKLICFSLYSSSSSSSVHSSRRFEEESRNVRVSVWWDVEKCCFPSGINVFKIGQCISNAVRVNGIKGPIHISAFGDLLCLSRPHQVALSSTGINLIHVPNGGKNSADQSLLVDLMHWVSQNPPPAHVFMISSDTEFAGILHKLRMNNYNILLASNAGVHTPGILSSAATIMWHWNELAKGENLSGHHFNQPPDGPFNSWYGHYRGPLEDPFDVPEQQNSSNTNEISENRQLIPQAVLKQIGQAIRSCPDGISSGEFRRLLVTKKVVIDKNLYGHKRFSQFVKSIPNIIKVIPGDDGRLYLSPVVSVDSLASSMIEDGNQDVQISENVKDRNQPITKMVDFEPRLPDSSDDSLKEEKVKPKVESSSEKKGSDSKDEIGRFRRWWRKWFMGSVEIEKTIDIPDKNNVSVREEKSLSEEETMASTNQHEIRGSENVVKSDKNGQSEVGLGFMKKDLSWSKPGKNELPVNTTTEQSAEKPILEDLKDEDKLALVNLEEGPKSLKHELFSKETFWSAFESFLRTYRASEIILNSKSREQLARRLKNDGPLNLRSLQEIDLLQLVDVLISEKKYIKEFPTRSSRFQPNPPPGKSITTKKPSEKARSEILADCRKLLDELLGQCPEGFKVGLFKKRFLEKYGYVLDHQKLGYPKLVSLLQTMSDLPMKRKNGESSWEDLGPVEESKSKVEVNHEYEPCVSDNDEFSDMEEDQTRPRVKEEDSSLLRILNSCHSPKDDNDPETVQGLNPEEKSGQSGPTVVAGKCGGSFVDSSGKKPRVSKGYSLVADSMESNKDKSGELGMQS